MNKKIVELTDLEAEKVHACIMRIAQDFVLECYVAKIDIDSSDEEAQRYRFYRDLAKKFE